MRLELADRGQALRFTVIVGILAPVGLLVATAWMLSDRGLPSAWLIPAALLPLGMALIAPPWLMKPRSGAPPRRLSIRAVNALVAGGVVAGQLSSTHARDTWLSPLAAALSGMICAVMGRLRWLQYRHATGQLRYDPDSQLDPRRNAPKAKRGSHA